MAHHPHLHRILTPLWLLVGLFIIPGWVSASSSSDSVTTMISESSELASVTFIVNTTDDTVDAAPGNGICAAANGLCTLRAAVTEANAISTGVLIKLPAGVFYFPATSPVSSAHLTTTTEMTVEGISPTETILDGGGVPPSGQSLPVIHAMGNLTLKNLSLQHGFQFVMSAGFYDGYQTYGGVTARNTLVLDHVDSSNNVMGVYAAPLTKNWIPQTNPEVIVKNSTIHHNISTGVHVQGTLSMDNSTVSNNLEQGGILVDGSAVIQNSTISANSLKIPGYYVAAGVYHSSESGTVLLNHTIVAGNDYYGVPFDCKGNIVSIGYNLIGTLDGCSFTAAISDLIGIDPLLAPPALNGGLTQTHALLVNSPAIDTGNPAGCGVVTDQRGFARPQDGDGNGTAVCDIGAYEAIYDPPYKVYLPVVVR